MTSDHTSCRSASQRYEFIDALRGMAALYVTIFHMAVLSSISPPDWAQNFVTQGASGVMLFYLISGFCLCLSAKQGFEKPCFLKEFYLRRIFRIVPLFYFSIIIALIRSRYWYPEPVTPGDIGLSLLFVFNFIPGKEGGIVWASWTLGVEMVFYLIFPLIHRFVRNDILHAFHFMIISTVVMILYTFLFPLIPMEQTLRYSFFRFSFFRHLPVFALGILMFFIWKNQIRTVSVFRSWGSSLIAMASIALINFCFYNLYSFPSAAVWISIIYSILILGLSIHPVRVVVNRLTCFYGKISYSIYLNHPIIILLLIPWYHRIYESNYPVMIQFAACCLMTMVPLTAVSCMTYFWVEEPGMKLGKYLIMKTQAQVRHKATVDRYQEIHPNPSSPIYRENL